jgi:negative regulator of sigma E activity
MTTPHDPHEPHPLDELASAHLDGLTTADEAALVARDPELASRVAAMAAARDRVRRGLPPVDSGRREQAIAAALAAFDAEAATSPGRAPVPAAPLPVPELVPVVELGAVRRTLVRRRLRLVGAAAAVLLAVAVPLLSQVGGKDEADDVAATTFQTESGTDRQAADDAAEGGSVAPTDTAMATPEVALAATDIGPFDSEAALVDVVRSLVASITPSTTLDTAAPPGTEIVQAPASCPDLLDGTDPVTGVITFTATATLQGRPVVLSVYERAPGQQELVVYDAADCAVVTSVIL